MKKIPVNIPFTNREAESQLVNEDVIEVKTIICDNFYYKNNIDGSINKYFLRKPDRIPS